MRTRLARRVTKEVRLGSAMKTADQTEWAAGLGDSTVVFGSSRCREQRAPEAGSLVLKGTREHGQQACNQAEPGRANLHS